MVDTLNKIEYLKELVKKRNKMGVVIKSFANLSWLGIRRPHVLSVSESTIVKLIITLEGVFLIANNIEMDRLLKEELDEALVKIVTPITFMWYEDYKFPFVDQELLIDEVEIEAEIKLRRMILTEKEMLKASVLGADLAEIAEGVLPYIKKGMTERDISGMLYKLCVERSIEAGLALCASSKRALLYRHPIATSEIIDDLVMIILTVRRDGMYSCLSRMVALDQVDEEVLRKRDAVLAVECAYMKYSKEGMNIRDVFYKGQEVYREYGFSDEWKNHHQGGITGYLSREDKMTGRSDIIIKNGMSFSYNPTVPAYKAEDTFYLKENKPILTTETTNLPTVRVEFEGEIYQRPDIIRM
ncbi:M24 family metallopeptidase [Chakrabartyella piscis]|uniref:M24 family metallopeptidase n=1 Tax=Chakrabartyella piscis TaxID=2918914 RepID=UPI002958DD49|nr:M24 family metallopeptidase [Chakrabartyella piscis]